MTLRKVERDECEGGGKTEDGRDMREARGRVGRKGRGRKGRLSVAEGRQIT